MGGFHTITIYVPKLAALHVAQFYRLVSKAAEHYEAVDDPPPFPAYAEWETIMFTSTPTHDCMEVYSCRGKHMEQLTISKKSRGHWKIGYMHITHIIQLYWDVFMHGLYVEILGYKENIADRDYCSELYVRVPRVHASLYAVLRSPVSHEQVWDNDYRAKLAPKMYHHGYGLPSAARFMMPITQCRPAEYESQAMLLEVQRLKTMTPPSQYNLMFAFANVLREHYYNREFVDGDNIYDEEHPDYKYLEEICDYLHNGASDDDCEQLRAILQRPTVGFDLESLHGVLARLMQVS